MMRSTEASAARASGRNRPWVSEITPRVATARTIAAHGRDLNVAWLTCVRIAAEPMLIGKSGIFFPRCFAATNARRREFHGRSRAKLAIVSQVRSSRLRPSSRFPHGEVSRYDKNKHVTSIGWKRAQQTGKAQDPGPGSGGGGDGGGVLQQSLGHQSWRGRFRRTRGRWRKERQYPGRWRGRRHHRQHRYYRRQVERGSA